MRKERKNIFLKAAVLSLAVLVFAAPLCGCMVMLPQVMKVLANGQIETSTKYMVGFDYSSYKDVFGMAPVITCTVRYDKSVDATFGWMDENGMRDTRTLNFALTDEQYSNIEQNVNPQEIYFLNPKCADPSEVCDGGSCWLFIYGPDDAVMKECGGFCPESKRYHEIRRTLFDNLPEELVEVYFQYEKIYETQWTEGNTQVDDELRTLFDETFSQYLAG